MIRLCAFVHMHVCECIFACVFVCIFACVCVFVCMCVFVCVHECMCMNVCAHARVNVCACVCFCLVKGLTTVYQSTPTSTFNSITFDKKRGFNLSEITIYKKGFRKEKLSIKRLKCSNSIPYVPSVMDCSNYWCLDAR